MLIRTHGQSKQAGTAPERRARLGGFTLIEALVASAVMGMLVMACYSAVIFDEVAARRSKEEAIAMDFISQYVENLRALPFTSISSGLPINSLYDGVGGAPNISIPTSGAWTSVNTTSYQAFYPDLLWLTNRNPQLQVTLTSNKVSGVLHDIQINVKLDWDPPLKQGNRLDVQVDVIRTVAM